MWSVQVSSRIAVHITMRTVAIVAVLLTLVGVGPTSAQNTQLLGTAGSAVVQSDVFFNKDNKFDTDPIPLSVLAQ